MLRVSALIVAVSIMAPIAGAQAIQLVTEGRSDYVIVLPAQPSPAEQRGADELRTFIQQMSGAELPIVHTDPAPEKSICLSTRGASQGPGSKLGPEDFTLRTTEGRILITGGGPRGTMYGCDTLLEKLGVRWFTPRVTRLPQNRSIELQPTDEKQSPAFEYREAYFTEAFDKDWAARLKMNGSNAHLDDSVGGRIIYHHFVHSFNDLVPPTLFAEHPEYFPLIGGKREGGYVQRCLTNPDVLKLAIQGVKAWIAERPDATIYSVSQNDVAKWCECDNCKRITEQYGAHSGLYLWFVNQVAEAIEKEHPDKLIDTLAYQFTEAPPKGIVPRRNVRVRLCPISVCEAHPYEKCSAPPTVAFVKNLAEWSKITDTLYIWHYNTNFAHYLMPFPDFDEFPADIRLYQRSGVKGIFFQGAYGPGGGGSDAELRSYVMAKLLWDPKLDSDALVNEWMAGVYGPAAKPMRAWFDLLQEKARDPNHHFFIFGPPTVEYLSEDVLAAGHKFFDEARAAAAADPVAADYVGRASLWLRYVVLVRHPTDGEEFKQFVADLKKAGTTYVSEGQSVEEWEKAYLANIKK